MGVPECPLRPWSLVIHRPPWILGIQGGPRSQGKLANPANSRYNSILKFKIFNFSKYNFEIADTDVLFRQFDEAESMNTKLIEKELPFPAYEQTIKASHLFNLLDARHAISVTDRARFIRRVRSMSQKVAQAYYESRERLGFPMLKNKN